MRPSKDEYYLSIAKKVAGRATCYRLRGGAIIVNKDDVIVSTGYNGAVRKVKDCFDRGECLRDKLKIPHGRQYECCRSVHAEQNTLINASRSGASVLGGNMYFWAEDSQGRAREGLPCFICKKMIINAGINRFIGSTQQGGYRIFEIQDWIQDWQEKDILDDKHQYGDDLNKKENLNNN